MFSIKPVLINASTIINKPATNGNILHEMPLITFNGDWRAINKTTKEVIAPVIIVGKPNCMWKADASNNTIAAAQIPRAAALPPRIKPAFRCYFLLTGSETFFATYTTLNK